MSRNKKSRSLKRVTGGVETGSKERTKLEKKQNKARKKATSSTGKVKRQRSVYQKAEDEINALKPKRAPKKLPPLDLSAINQSKPKKEVVIDDVVIDDVMSNSNDVELSDEDLLDQLENPGKSDIF